MVAFGMLEGKAVLVVEDEVLICQLLESMLEDCGCNNISVAVDIPQAMEALDQQKPDLVLLDLNLAGTSSLPIAVRLQDQHIPFVFSSGYTAGALAPEWQKYPLITKPYMSDELEAKIARALAMNVPG